MIATKPFHKNTKEIGDMSVVVVVVVLVKLVWFNASDLVFQSQSMSPSGTLDSHKMTDLSSSANSRRVINRALGFPLSWEFVRDQIRKNYILKTTPHFCFPSLPWRNHTHHSLALLMHFDQQREINCGFSLDRFRNPFGHMWLFRLKTDVSLGLIRHLSYDYLKRNINHECSHVRKQ